jgi:hypothetical protein
MDYETLKHFWIAVIYNNSQILSSYIENKIISSQSHYIIDPVHIPQNIDIYEAFDKITKVIHNHNYKKHIINFHKTNLISKNILERIVTLVFKIKNFDINSNKNRAFFCTSSINKPSIDKWNNLIYALIATCQQNILHYHSILIFSYPKNLNKLEEDIPSTNIESVYSSVYKCIQYIKNQAIEIETYISNGWENQINWINSTDEKILSDQYDLPYMSSMNVNQMKHISRWNFYSLCYFSTNNINKAKMVANMLCYEYFNCDDDIFYYSPFVIYKYQPIFIIDCSNYILPSLLTPPPFIILINSDFIPRKRIEITNLINLPKLEKMINIYIDHI